jgi:hypothetical protein
LWNGWSKGERFHTGSQKGGGGGGGGGVGEGSVADYFGVNCLFTSRIQLPSHPNLV